jgi:hypothetical protein
LKKLIEGRKNFFFEKRSKKLLLLGRGGAASRGPNSRSFFASFFSKKEVLAFLNLCSVV